MNYGGYCKPETDALLDESRSSLNPGDRIKSYEKIAAALDKERPIVYLFHRDWLWAYTPKLGGVKEIPDGLLRMTGLKYN